MSPGARITHLMRAVIVGGSELETLALVRSFPRYSHRLLFPARFRAWQPSLLDRVPPGTEVAAVDDVERALEEEPPELLHIQFPFLMTGAPRGLDSVLELRCLPPVPTLFTVHAAVNVPVVPDVHYVFHTEDLRRRFLPALPEARTSVCPSLVDPPAPSGGREPGVVRILWVSRNEDAKFHLEVPVIVASVLDAVPEARFRFVGIPPTRPLPTGARVQAVPCPAPDLAAEYACADVFWYWPDPRLEETWCRTLTEAMAAGLACVAPSWGGPAAQIQHGLHGLLAPSSQGCVRGLIELARDAGRRRALGERAAARAESFRARALETWERLYAERLEPSPLSRGE